MKSLLLWNENQIITNQLVRQIGFVTQEADQNNQRRWTNSDENPFLGDEPVDSRNLFLYRILHSAYFRHFLISLRQTF